MFVPVGTNLTGVVYVADTNTSSASSVSSATKYAIFFEMFEFFSCWLVHKTTFPEYGPR